MPDPITAQLINNAWKDIEDAVTSGLAMAGPYGVPCPALETVAVVATEKLSDVKNWRHAQAPDAPPRVRVEKSEPGDAFDIMHHFDLSYHELYAPDTEAIKKWATRARQFELSLVLREYAVRAVRRPFEAGELYRADPDGWGQRRCVVFSSAGGGTIPDKWEQADLERTVKVDIKPENGIHALVFRIAGGPYVRRPAGLSLSWTPVDHCKAELLLTEQLELVNLRESAVIGIEMIQPRLGPVGIVRGAAAGRPESPPDTGKERASRAGYRESGGRPLRKPS